MKNTFTFTLLAFFFFVSCDKEDTIQEEINDLGYLKLESLSSQNISGSIADGKLLSTLDWAWNSSIACFVEPAKSRFTGKHTFYQIDLPRNSVITIKLIPENSSSSLGLYAYSKGEGVVVLPEDLNSCISCEADPSNNNGAQTGTREVELNAINNPYSVVIGVAGAEGELDASFILEVNIAN